MSNGNGHSWSKFWWDDWQNDPDLKLCSLAAQAVWMRLLCMMFNGNGELLLNSGSGNRQPTVREIATITSVPERQLNRCIEELLARGVARKNNDGVIYCQRMVNDFKASEVGRASATKRWNGPDPNGSPNGKAIEPPTQEPKREAYSQAWRDPNAKKLEAREEKKEPPRSPPVSRGGRAARSKPPRNFFHAKAKQEGIAPVTIDAVAEKPTPIVDFLEFTSVRPRRIGGANG